MQVTQHWASCIAACGMMESGQRYGAGFLALALRCSVLHGATEVKDLIPPDAKLTTEDMWFDFGA